MQRLKSRAKHQKPHPRNDLPYAVALGQVSPSPGLLLAAQDKENGAFDKRGGRGVPSVMSRYRADTPRKRESRIMISKSGGHHRGIDGSPLCPAAGGGDGEGGRPAAPVQFASPHSRSAN